MAGLVLGNMRPRTHPYPTSLPLVLRRHGFVMTQIERTAGTAIYSQRLTGGRLIAFEAIRVRMRAEGTLAGKTLPAREVYPGDARWGRDGWTFSTYGGKVTTDSALEQARAKALALRSPLNA